mgnify:CR=1 FL=1
MNVYIDYMIIYPLLTLYYLHTTIYLHYTTLTLTLYRLADATFRVNEMDALVTHVCQLAQLPLEGTLLREKQRYW